MLSSVRNLLLTLILAVFPVGSLWAACPDGDLTGDCEVDFEDVRVLAEQWLSPPGSLADLDGLNGVEARDFALLANKWCETGIPLVINEFMASNNSTKPDPQGQYDDWIEIYNAGEDAIDAGGMHLTDNLGDGTKWQIPAGNPLLTTISPGGYLVIWADKDEDDNGTVASGLHAPFELSAGGEEIGLFDSNGTILIDSIEFPDQDTDISYGRYPDGSDTWRLFVSPSPGSRNVGRYYGFVSDLEFSHERGFYDKSFSVTITCDTEGAGIYYSVDGTEPGKIEGRFLTGIRYSLPLSIGKTTCLRARARKVGWESSDVATHTYIFVRDVVTQSLGGEAPGPGWPAPGYVNSQVIDYGMDPDVVNSSRYERLMGDALLAVPSISLVTKLGSLFDPETGIYVNAYNEGQAWERPASAELVNPDGSKGFQIDAGLRIRGGFSRSGNNPKHAFRLLFGSEYGGKLRFPLFGDEGVDEFENVDLRCSQNYSWSFQNSSQNTAVREVFSRDVQGRTCHPYTRSRYYHLYINGQYWGLFQTQERSEASFAESYMGGDKDDYDVVKADRSVGRAMWATDGNMDAYRRLYDAAMAGLGSNSTYYRLQGLNSDGTPNPTYEKLLDVDNLIDFMIIEYYTGDRDGPGSRFGNKPNNTYCIYNRRDPDGWKSFHHDNEHTLGVSNSAENMVTPFSSAGSQWKYFNPHWLHERLATQNIDYRMHFADHVYKHFFNDGLLTPSVSRARISNRVEQIDLAIIGESARWGDAKRSTPFTKDVHWVPEINDLLNNYLPLRTNKVLSQFKGVGWYPNIQPPLFSDPSGHVGSGYDVTLSGSGGTLYYTDDGSDPRRQGGSVNSSAKFYSGPINIVASTHVKARLKSGSTWSVLSEATYAVGPVAENLRITEIMYHPQFTGNPNDANEEFIELKNIGEAPINLNLVRFTNGIDFTFGDLELGAGEYVLVVKNHAAFDAQYPGFSGVIAGEYTGSLNNGGERIELQDAVGQTILNFRYNDAWRRITDGRGFSLTIIDPSDSVPGRPDEGLVAHWALDDGPGTLAIDSAGSNNGTLSGDPAWTAGRIGEALTFDGSGDYVSFSSIGALTGNNLTAEAWIRVTGLTGIWNPILTQHNPNNDGYYLYVYEDKPAFSVVGSGGTAVAGSPEVINWGQWYHIAGTNDGSNLRIYIDGHLKDSGPSAGLTGVDYAAYIGYDYASVAYYTGQIDDVRIYNRALSEEEFGDIISSVERWNEKDSWRASAYVGGSPGSDDSGIIPNPGAVVINELLAHSPGTPGNWIELYNTTDAQIDIGRWYLSDSEFNLQKYRFADGTKIDAGEYLVLYENTHFGESSSDPGRITTFAFSDTGGKAYLTSAEAGVLTGYRAVEDFGASETDVSFGRYFKRSTGNYNFVSMSVARPGLPNAYPKVGPIVINEIMYHPDWPAGGSYENDRYEYIELRNISPAPVKLYDDDKALAWKFTDGIQFTFPDWPNEVTIPAGGYLLVVKDVNAFTWLYPTVPAEKIVGPYDGQLSNSGLSGSGEDEWVELGMPGNKDSIGRRHYIRIDRVNYSDGSHPDNCPGGVDLWPTEADGGGKSLTRTIPANYGNDPNNWEAQDPSPVW